MGYRKRNSKSQGFCGVQIAGGNRHALTEATDETRLWWGGGSDEGSGKDGIPPESLRDSFPPLGKGGIRAKIANAIEHRRKQGSRKIARFFGVQIAGGNRHALTEATDEKRNNTLNKAIIAEQLSKKKNRYPKKA